MSEHSLEPLEELPSAEELGLPFRGHELLELIGKDFFYMEMYDEAREQLKGPKPV